MNDVSESGRAAGGFLDWLRDMQAALRDEHDAEVPCDGCTACCRASQFIHIGPAETEALARIPKALQFPAPRLPDGHVVVGYDQDGRCPMLVNDACSIYEHRPRTCRTYDCRVFAATGIELDEADKAEIRARAEQWRFEHPTDDDRRAHDELIAVAVELRRTKPAMTATQLAVEAIQGTL